jgi:hypothetical protein
MRPIEWNHRNGLRADPLSPCSANASRDVELRRLPDVDHGKKRGKPLDCGASRGNAQPASVPSVENFRTGLIDPSHIDALVLDRGVIKGSCDQLKSLSRLDRFPDSHVNTSTCDIGSLRSRSQAQQCRITGDY